MKHLTQLMAVTIVLLLASCATQKTMPASAPGKSDVYIIQRGDTFAGIANQNHLTIKQLKDLNPAAPQKVKVGQELHVLPQVSK